MEDATSQGSDCSRDVGLLVAHHNANAVKIVCVGTFTADAEQFAEGKAIELINGERLLELVRAVQTSSPISNTEQSPSSAKRDCGVTEVSKLRCGDGQARQSPDGSIVLGMQQVSGLPGHAADLTTSSRTFGHCASKTARSNIIRRILLLSSKGTINSSDGSRSMAKSNSGCFAVPSKST